MFIGGCKWQTYYFSGSDTECCSYSINEARAYGVQTVTTPLPYLEEIGINRDNAIILDFDCGNINEVVEKIKNVKRVEWQPPQDNYMKYLYKGKSKYEKRGLVRMEKRIRVKQKFLDMKHNNVLRRVGEEFVEDSKRAEDLIERGFCLFVEDVKAKKEKAIDVIETAVKEEKKEKAVKEKAVRKNAKKQ